LIYGLKSFGFVGLARLARFFLLLSQKKEPKEKAAPCHGPSAPLRYSTSQAAAQLALIASKKR
jgi:hypothetical protein